jgi:hypothetical protein
VTVICRIFDPVIELDMPHITRFIFALLEANFADYSEVLRGKLTSDSGQAVLKSIYQ